MKCLYMMMEVASNFKLFLMILITLMSIRSESSGIKKTPLGGVVACVTGATRGIGKGIALALAENGATIYITGRSATKSSITVSDKELGGCLEDVATEIVSLGGKCIPVIVDHKDEKQVEDLFKMIAFQHGQLDLLVNNAFQIPTRPDGAFDKDLLFRDFWEQPGWYWDSLINVGLRSHYISSCYAIPLMRVSKPLYPHRKPLIVHISSFGGASYSFNVAYGVGKAGVDRMARDMNQELSKLGIICLSLYPGVVRTERMAGVLDSGVWREKTGLELPKSFVESPQLTGQVIAALFDRSAEDGFLQKMAGKVCVTAEVAKRYGIRDPVSQEIPPSIRSVKFLVPSLVLGSLSLSEDSRRWIEPLLISLSPDILLPMSLMAQGTPQQPALDKE